MDSNKKVLDVHIGEVKIAKHGESLKAILGSCVGIALIWEQQGKCGLAHAFLPQSPTTTYQIGAKYVDQAVRSLMAMMKIKGENTQDVSAIVVGGGNMTADEDKNQKKLVGASNFKNALKEIESRGFNLTYSEGGGTLGRKITVDGANFTYRVETIPRISSMK